jgi:hypothetical protein
VKVGITGHQHLADASSWDWVKMEMNNLLARLPRPIVGITCLAVGADSLFAELVLQHSGSIEAVLPFPEYEHELQIHERVRYRELLAMVSTITVLEKKPSKEESYFEAGKKVVDNAELLLAVWDKKPARGLGGTGDIVEYASQRQKDITCIDPINRLVTSSRPLPWLRQS